ncbi:glycoside hydrolase family 97 protein [Solilutibacter silvestris]|uniref:Glycoside hydrolase 97 n=1 Tax=Solilutibacter silvestris TaxID=1645665 RepID=A0A2K1PZ33_9GAMM|nr:glycoside hydrolase family 97 protein [Lysobacter silvestris]PNS08054.1 Glycoside hydrolase 97 [Lysobacter silvestris]
MKSKLFTLLLLFSPLLAHADEDVAHASSPDGRITVTLDLNGEGRVGYKVSRDGKPVIGDSRMGFLLRNGEELLRNFKLESQTARSVDETWDQPWGERLHTRNHYNELVATFVETGRGKRKFDVVFRVFDDGLGFRYSFPKQPNLGRMEIVDEVTEFDIVRTATALWEPAGEWNRYEYLYNKTPLNQLSQAHTPMTMKTDDGLYLSIHEAALVDYASMWLRRVDGQRLKARLAPGGTQPASVIRETPFATPWRTIEIADRAGGLVESSLILNLNDPNVLGDVSWFKPSKYVGVWWSMHLDQQSWATGPKHAATTDNTRRYIDFAAANGFRGVLVEGWNPGWDGDWFANGWNFDFTKATPDFDIEALSKYAAAKGVHLIGHHENGCAVSHYMSQLDAALDLDQRLGIDQVKTGHVCDAGQIERQDVANGPVTREWHDGQWMSNVHLQVVKEAAKRHIAINPHEPIKDTGLRRTYPNWISREGARGMEYNAWGSPPNPPEHEINLVFTRMLAGPMDYTPGVLSLTGRGGQEIQSTIARQLALYVTIYSPIQMAADLPEHYAQHMDAFQFIRDVPTDWQDTRMVNGEIGEYVTIARKARGSDDWYLGSMSDRNARTLKVPLSFLDAGKKYRAEIYRDGAGADWHGAARFKFAKETRTVTAKDVLDLWLAGGGGAAIRFVALK